MQLLYQIGDYDFHFCAGCMDALDGVRTVVSFCPHCELQLPAYRTKEELGDILEFHVSHCEKLPKVLKVTVEQS